MENRKPLLEKNKDTIPLQNHWEEFCNELLEKTELFAKKYRYTLTAKVIHLALNIQHDIICARFTTDKLSILQKLHIDLEFMDTLLRLCYRKKLFSHKGYEYTCRELQKATQMVAGWKKQQQQK